MSHNLNWGATLLKWLRKHWEVCSKELDPLWFVNHTNGTNSHTSHWCHHRLIDMLPICVIQSSVAFEFVFIHVFRYTDVLVILCQVQQATTNTVLTLSTWARTTKDDVIKLKYFLCYWPFMQEIHRSPVNSPQKGQWCRALMFSLICTWINGWVNNH